MGEVHVAIEPVGGADPGGLSVCRTPLGLMLSGVTSKEEFLSFPSSARPGKGFVRPTTKRRKAPRAGGELRAVHRGTDWRRQGEAGGSAVRGPHAKINCSFGDSFTGENSCMASGQLTQPALMRVRRMHPTSLKCCSPKTTNIVQLMVGKYDVITNGRRFRERQEINGIPM